MESASFTISPNLGVRSRATMSAAARARSKISIEPARTSKVTQKLVVFPEADEAQQAQEQILQDDAYEELKTMELGPEIGKKLRRVTAYLTAESFNIQSLQDHFGGGKYGFSDAKRVDEVFYCKFFSDAHLKDEVSNFEAAVASPSSVGEVLVFDYGAIVIWGLEEFEEKKILFSMQPYETSRLTLDEIEKENFYFCHNYERPPRLFNDVIHLRSGHYMVKMTISHALAQSVKLAYFEKLIDNTIFRTKHIPVELAVSGTIKMSRKDINKQIGDLFVMRMNVNLVSNVLDTPELFWSYPSLGPLYRAVRGYLEISQRADVLNQRCTVLSNMLDMLRDHANIMHGEVLEWIIIVLIAFEIFIGLAKAGIDIWSRAKY